LSDFLLDILIIALCCRFQIGLDQYIKIEDTWVCYFRCLGLAICGDG